MAFRAVLFDRRGTLVVSPTFEDWAREALRRLGRPDPAVIAFAHDAAPSVRRLKDAGLRVAVVSDIHMDIRPAFDAAGRGGLVDVFTLSVEQGVQEPEPAMFTRTLGAHAVASDEALMVGVRSRLCGAADSRISHAR